MKKVQDPELSALLLKTVEVYNRYRSPEAAAKLLRLQEDGFIIAFQGSFCKSCGVQDYFEDFIYELKSFNSSVEVEIGEIEQTSPRSFKVQYIVKSGFPDGKLHDEALFEEFLHERGLSVEDYMTSNPCTRDITRFHFRTWLFEKKNEKKS